MNSEHKAPTMPQMETVTAPIVGGAATAGSLHGGSVTVSRAPDPHSQDRQQVSPLVNNAPTNSL